MRIIRREIRVGSKVVIGAVCSRCPSIAVIYPIEALKPHLEWHNQPIDHHFGHTQPRHHRGGRTAGALAKLAMSSTGVEKRESIRRIARAR